MKFRIGIDFDNTIACYEHVFMHGAWAQGLVLDDVILSKPAIKEKILAQVDGDSNWQKLQGQIYGKYMHKASVFPGFAEFLMLAKSRGHDIFIVSHKTEFGHFDEEKISLPAEALKWLIKNKFVGEKSGMLQKDVVFFEPTREKKIERITSLSCTHFVDDLPEVLDEPAFPGRTEKILFIPGLAVDKSILSYSSGSWRAITRRILGDWTENDIRSSIQYIFPDLNVEKVELKKGRGNSRIYKLYTSHSNAYALKVYPDLQLDSRHRLEIEFSASRILGEAGFPVAKAISKNTDMNWAVFSWIDGEIETTNEEFINKSVEFIQQLMILSKTSEKVKTFSNASEACLSGLEITRQIQNRFDRLKVGPYTQVNFFLQEEFLPIFEQSVEIAKTLIKDDFYKIMDSDLLMLSPSDFGAHNSILHPNGQTYFIDFEYFGWDDPVKLACDFYWHPAMNLGDELQTIWKKKIKAIFANDKGFEARFRAYLPLFGLRWCLILLNEFLPDKIAQRIHANYEKEHKIADVQQIQLDKSKHILDIIKTTLNHG